MRRLFSWMTRPKIEKIENVLTSVMTNDVKPKVIADFILEKCLTVEGFSLDETSRRPLSLYELICRRKDGAKHIVFIWRDGSNQTLFRSELSYFGVNLPPLETT